VKLGLSVISQVPNEDNVSFVLSARPSGLNSKGFNTYNKTVDILMKLWVIILIINRINNKLHTMIEKLRQ